MLVDIKSAVSAMYNHSGSEPPAVRMCSPYLEEPDHVHIQIRTAYGTRIGSIDVQMLAVGTASIWTSIFPILVPYAVHNRTIPLIASSSSPDEGPLGSPETCWHLFTVVTPNKMF